MESGLPFWQRSQSLLLPLIQDEILTFKQILGDNWTSLSKAQLSMMNERFSIISPGSKRTVNRTQALDQVVANHAR